MERLRRLVDVLDIAVIKPIQILIGLLLVATIFYWLQFGFDVALCKVADLTGADILCSDSGVRVSSDRPSFEDVVASGLRPADLFWTYVGVALAGAAQMAFTTFLVTRCQSETMQSYRSGFLWLGELRERRVSSFDDGLCWIGLAVSAAVWAAALYAAVTALDGNHRMAMLGLSNDAIVTFAVGAFAWIVCSAIGAQIARVDKEHKNSVAALLVFLGFVSMAGGSSAFAAAGGGSLRSCGESPMEILGAAQGAGMFGNELAIACMQPVSRGALTIQIYAVTVRPSSDRLLRPCSVGVREVEVSSQGPEIRDFREVATYSGQYCSQSVLEYDPREVGVDLLSTSSGPSLRSAVLAVSQE